MGRIIRIDYAAVIENLVKKASIRLENCDIDEGERCVIYARALYNHIRSANPLFEHGLGKLIENCEYFFGLDIKREDV